MRYPRSIETVLFALLLLVGGAAAAGSSLPDFTELAEAGGPSVVNISTTQKVRHPGGPLPPGVPMPEFPEGSPWGELFERFFGQQNGTPEAFETQSLGSGFVIDASGYILTNNHVVADATEIIVRLSDRRELEAELVGRDERSDVALLKVDADDLPVARIGRSDNLKVGEWVMAIGSPFGFDHSVSVGVISALGRSLPSESYVPFIQTDVAINPGNSGGPLFNQRGEVIGVNSQIYSRTGGYMGLSFAIPIGVAMEVADQLREKGRVSRGWLGVLIQDVTRELAESFGMEKPEGALVAKVIEESPAAEAGLQVGDVIVEFNGETVEQSSDLPPLVGRTPVGSSAKAKVVRDGKVRHLTVTIGELPEEDTAATGRPTQSEQAASRIGLAVADLTAEQREKLDLGDGGVGVKQVAPDSPAQAAGVQRGDVVVKLNNVDVKNAAHFRELVAALPAGRSVPVLVQRRGSPLFLALKVPEEE